MSEWSVLAQTRATQAMRSLGAKRLLLDLERLGFKVREEGGQLKVKPSVTDAGLRARIVQGKEDLLAMLRGGLAEPWIEDEATRLVQKAIRRRDAVGYAPETARTLEQFAVEDRIDDAWLKQDLRGLKAAVEACLEMFALEAMS